MTLNELRDIATEAARSKGFHDGRADRGRDDTLIRLGLIHTEVSEAMQLVKRHGPNGREGEIGEELADVLIRVGDLAGLLGIDLDRHVRAKLAKNSQRPYKYGTPDDERLQKDQGVLAAGTPPAAGG